MLSNEYRRQLRQSREILRLAADGLFANRVEASLAAGGLMIGCASLVLVITIASVGRSYALHSIEGVGANLAYATLDRGASESYTPQDEITLSDLEVVRASVVPIARAAGTYDIFVEFGLNGAHRHGALVAVTEQFEDIRRLTIVSGRYFDAEDYKSRAKVCLVTDFSAKAACRRDSCLGKTLSIEQFTCTVVGTFQEGVPTFGQSEIQKDTVLIAFPLLREVNGENYLQVLYAQARTRGEVPWMADEIHRILRSRHSPAARYRVDHLGIVLGAAENISRAMTASLVVFALLTMTIAGVGIANVMLANVAERQHEIGVRKAVGATVKAIRFQFLAEALIISLIGAVAGVTVACSAILVVSHWLRPYVALSIPLTTAVLSCVACIIIGTVSGYDPARRASMVQPVDALRAD